MCAIGVLCRCSGAVKEPNKLQVLVPLILLNLKALWIVAEQPDITERNQVHSLLFTVLALFPKRYTKDDQKPEKDEVNIIHSLLNFTLRYISDNLSLLHINPQMTG